MKKLMIAAAIVCAAAFAQASTVTWGYEGDIKNAAGSSVVDGTAYIFYLGASGSFQVFDDGTYKLDGGAQALSFDNIEGNNIPILSGALNDLEMPVSQENRNAKYALVMMYQNDLDNGAYYYNYFETTASGLIDDAGDTKDVVFSTSSSVNLSVKGESVPEPTSGLLLLLGVAGLALKRRRA